jgi:hypothetical protein
LIGLKNSYPWYKFEENRWSRFRENREKHGFLVIFRHFSQEYYGAPEIFPEMRLMLVDRAYK